MLTKLRLAFKRLWCGLAHAQDYHNYDYTDEDEEYIRCKKCDCTFNVEDIEKW